MSCAVSDLAFDYYGEVRLYGMGLDLSTSVLRDHHIKSCSEGARTFAVGPDNNCQPFQRSVQMVPNGRYSSVPDYPYGKEYGCLQRLWLAASKEPR